MSKSTKAMKRAQYRVYVNEGMGELWDWTQSAPPNVSVPAGIAFFARYGLLRWMEVTGRSSAATQVGGGLASKASIGSGFSVPAAPAHPYVGGEDEALAVFGDLTVFDGPPITTR